MRLFITGILLLVSIACTHPSTSETRYRKLAVAYCECTAQLAVLNHQADTASPARLGAYFQQMQVEYDKAKECAATLVAEFGHLKQVELDSLNNALITHCPAVANKRELLQELLGE